ncbi:thioredoxin domain-containing protein, partial [Patulibacter sp. NPDC049589]|uniref:thioredoxin domain-containing protein n=1 Tax=Patulibacter sp. NPDC049589 TaxID=3154731 RepID=UPI00341B14DD
MRRDALRPSSPVIGGAVRALVVGASVAALVGCGSGSPSSGSAGGALSSATSCADFLGAPESQRQAWFARDLERYGSDGLNNANVTSNIGGACGQFPQRDLGWATRSGVQSVAGQTYTGLDAASRPEGADGTGTAGTRGTASTERPEPSASVTGVTETKALLAGVTQYGTLLGAPDAPVTIHEFADVKCPACQQFEVNSQKQNVDELVKT